MASCVEVSHLCFLLGLLLGVPSYFFQVCFMSFFGFAAYFLSCLLHTHSHALYSLDFFLNTFHGFFISALPVLRKVVITLLYHNFAGTAAMMRSCQLSGYERSSSSSTTSTRASGTTCFSFSTTCSDDAFEDLASLTSNFNRSRRPVFC